MSALPKKLRFVVAYDGTVFRGWQSQPDGGSVQDALEAAVAGIVGERLTVHGSGRTDAGVHALAQTAHIEIPCSHFQYLGRMQHPDRWVGALNAALPHSLRVLRVTRASANFHARFSATGKIYRYDIWNAPVLPPHLYHRVWHLYGQLDRGLLKELAMLTEGRHDFRGFCANSGSLPKETTRTLYRVVFQERGPRIRITLQGDGFLYRMVRMIVGGMVRVAQGKDTKENYRGRLAAGEPYVAPWTAPAEGLFMVRALYGTPKVRLP